MFIREPYNKEIVEKELLPLPFCHARYLLAPHTYYNIGGPADFTLIPRSEDEMEQAYSLLKTISCPHFILGGGTNVLISDKGFHGVILFTSQLKEFQELGNDRYFVSSGIELQWIVKEVILKNNYEGVGALTGIPGSMGGALYMNAGTVNGCICEWVESVLLLTTNGKREIHIEPNLYSYRSQTFCSSNDLILGAIFHFKKADTNQYPIYEHYINRRKEKQPQGHCCGSVFKNPTGTHAGELIEECGLKGTRCGGAIISPVHANFIINENNAKFDDVFSLIQLAKAKVKEKFGIVLEEEVRILFEDGCLQYCPHLTINKG
ncbi:MAG TPA: UDP-N-acetylmuramate dehydrogenase [Candidatus Hydrogenedens sp.]|nr:UDP-N-acetylmuramate dehydrogenase [Candidatus Hydrogenedens sp.]